MVGTARSAIFLISLMDEVLLSSPLSSSFDPVSDTDCELPRTERASFGRSMEIELIPRLLSQVRGASPTDSTEELRPAVIGPAEVSLFVQASLSHDEERCPAIITGLIEIGTPLERICLELLAPSARRLGEMWEEDTADFLEVTLGLGRLQRVVRELGRRIGGDTLLSADAGSAFLCGMPDEQHSLGLAMLAEFFVADGWGVTVGPPLGVDNVQHEISSHWYDVVGISVGVAERIPRIAVFIRQLRKASLNSDLAIMVGGRPFVANPALVEQVGADSSAPDAAQGPLVARTLVQTRRITRRKLLAPTDEQSA